jgi:hypothetical protein
MRMGICVCVCVFVSICACMCARAFFVGVDGYGVRLGQGWPRREASEA